MAYTLPSLPYAYSALEPYIDARTMELHHSKHHQAYVSKLNKALIDYPEIAQKPIEDILVSLDAVPEHIRTAVKNQGGGHANHTLFWTIMKPNGSKMPDGMLKQEINKVFEDFELFQQRFNTTAQKVFGSGWAWLVVDQNNRLAIIDTHDQDSPLPQGYTPVLGLDVWEHAYYLQYQNKRHDYIAAWWHVVDWEQVEERYRVIIS